MSVAAEYPTPAELWAMRAAPFEIALDAFEREEAIAAQYVASGHACPVCQRGLRDAEDETCEAWARVFDDVQAS